MNKIFVYGTLKSDKVQFELFGKTLEKYPARLKHFSLFEAEDGWYFVKERVGGVVEGFVVEMDDEDLKICDAFEYCPTMYERKMVKVVVNNELINTYAYFRIDDVGKYKGVTVSGGYSKLDEDEFIATEVKRFKEVEHPEFYETR